MMGGIPLSRDVNIIPSVIKASGQAIGLNGLVLSDSAYIPVGSVKAFASNDEVKAFFGAASDEHRLSVIYFKGVDKSTKTPEKIYFARFNRMDVGASLRSYPTRLNADDLKQLTGDVSIEVNGEIKTAQLDFSEVTSFNDAAQKIKTGFAGALDVTFDPRVKSFIFTIPNGGKDDRLGYASGTLADTLYLTQAKGAFLSQGAVAANASIMDQIVKTEQNWAGFTTQFEPDIDLALALSSWVSETNHRFFYVAWTSNDDAMIKDAPETLSKKIEEQQLSNVLPVYCSESSKPINALGYVASLNFDRERGRVPFKFRSLAGLDPDVANGDDYDNLIANGYSFYGHYASNAVKDDYWSDGKITGDFRWLDTYAGQIWLNANIQASITQLFRAYNQLPYNDEGRALIENCMISVVEQFKEWGGASIGTDLDEDQKRDIINIAGEDAISALFRKGYYIHIGRFTAAMRSQRISPEVHLIYADGGSIQKINMHSWEVE